MICKRNHPLMTLFGVLLPALFSIFFLCQDSFAIVSNPSDFSIWAWTSTQQNSFKTTVNTDYYNNGYLFRTNDFIYLKGISTTFPISVQTAEMVDVTLDYYIRSSNNSIYCYNTNNQILDGVWNKPNFDNLQAAIAIPGFDVWVGETSQYDCDPSYIRYRVNARLTARNGVTANSMTFRIGTTENQGWNNYTKAVIGKSNYNHTNDNSGIIVQVEVARLEQYLDMEQALQEEQVRLAREQAERDRQYEQQLRELYGDSYVDGDEEAANVEQGGQSLMQALNSLISALGNIHETNCNLPNFNIYGMNFSNMNMCTFTPPQPIMALASIGMVFIIVPLGIHVLKRILNLYSEILGGK